MKLKDLLRKLKDENTRLLGQLDEKVEEMKKLKDEVSQLDEVAIDDHSERQLEEAEKKEEVLEDQPVEKDEVHQMTETKEVKSKPYVAPRRRSPCRYVQKTRYDCTFHGYCFSCSKYGHIVADCRRYCRRDVGRSNTQIRCWTCGLFGHVSSICHTLRCYNCDGVGHKAQDCWYSRRQPIWNGSTRRTDEPWRRTTSGAGSSQKSAVAEQGRA